MPAAVVKAIDIPGNGATGTVKMGWRMAAARETLVVVPSPLGGEGCSQVQRRGAGEGGPWRKNLAIVPPHPSEYDQRPLCPLPRGERAQQQASLGGKPWAYLKVLQTAYKQLQPTRFEDLLILDRKKLI